MMDGIIFYHENKTGRSSDEIEVEVDGDTVCINAVTDSSTFSYNSTMIYVDFSTARKMAKAILAAVGDE